MFTNPASGARDAAQTYVRNLLDLLGDRNPRAVMEEQAAALRALAAGDPALLRAPEGPGKWSVLQVLQHLADTETVYGYRIRMIVAHDEPPIQGYDQDLWAERLRYNDDDPALVLEEFEAMRRRNLRLYRSLRPEELERAGLHSERGRESAGLIVRMLAGHDLVHRRQVERIRRAVGL
jgi:hypothetical protein